MASVPAMVRTEGRFSPYWITPVTISRRRPSFTCS